MPRYRIKVSHLTDGRWEAGVLDIEETHVEGECKATGRWQWDVRLTSEAGEAPELVDSGGAAHPVGAQGQDVKVLNGSPRRIEKTNREAAREANAEYKAAAAKTKFPVTPDSTDVPEVAQLVAA